MGLPATNSAGQSADGMIGAVRLLPRKPPVLEIPHPDRYELADQATLLGYDLPSQTVSWGESLELTLYWQAQTRMSESYHVFVHLDSAGTGGQTVAQGDKAPLDGDWPTWAWEPAQPFADHYTVRVPPGVAPGRYSVWVGMYRPTDGARLDVFGLADRIRDRAIWLADVEIGHQ